MRFESEVNIFNPSALSRKFSAIQTNFDVTLGKISAIISDSEIEQYQDGHTTMHSRLSSTIQDLDGFHEQVSEMQTSYDEEFSSIDSRLTTFDETLDGIQAGVSTVRQEAIKSDQIHYLATSASTGVTTETSGWTTTPQKITSTNKYLWTYHTYTKGDNSTTNTTPVISGVWGDRGLNGNPGISIADVVNYYLASPLSSGVTPDTSGWTTNIQTMTATNQYLWNYEVIIGSDDQVISTSDPIIIGRYGQNGRNGTDGNPGRGITSITEYYQKSSSNTTAPSTWSTSMVNTTSTDRYLWNYERIYYTDGTYEDSTKRVIGTHGEKGDAASVYEIRTTVDSIIRNKDGTASPTFVSFTCYRRVGTGASSTYPVYWIVEEYVNGSWVTTDSDGQQKSSITRYVSANATSVRATAYSNSSLSSASLVDRQDVPIIAEGSDGYTVILSNESHTFAGGESAAISGTAQSEVIAYKGTTRVAATIGTITGQPTGMTTSISNNGSTSARFNINVTTSMVTRSGMLNVPVTVDGNSFTLTFSYALALKGKDGENGVNTATLYLYRILTTTSTPSPPTNSTTYTFSTKTLSGTPGASWEKTMPTGNGTLWVAIATASSTTDTDTIEASEWSVVKLVRDGSPGGNGLDGYNKATITLYRRYASTPSKPFPATIYTFSTASLSTVPSGWSLSIPAVDSAHNPCYATSVSAVSREDTYTISSSAWTTPVKIVEDGEDGIGIQAQTAIRYVSSDGSNPPSKPQEDTKVTEDRPITGVWTKALPALNSTYKYIYTCDMFEWDNGSVTYSDVVLNNALSNLTTKVEEALLKIQDNAIIATVRNSEAYKSDLSSKNASYTGDGIPSASNYPANQWATDELKESHLGDTFLSNTGRIYQYVHGSNGLYITFSDESRTEAKWDYVRIYYQRDNKTYVLPDISGTDISGARIFVPSNIFWLYWHSDSSTQYYGFRITSIELAFGGWPAVTESTLPSVTATDISDDTYPETTHPYTANETRMWKYTRSGFSTPIYTYGWALRQDPSATNINERLSEAELKITDNAIVSTVTSSEFGQLMTSAIKQTADGIYLDAKYVSWNSTYSSMTQDGHLSCTGANIEGELRIALNNTYCTVGTIAHCTMMDYAPYSGLARTKKINTDCFYYGTYRSDKLKSTHTFDTSYSTYPQESITVAGDASVRLTTLAYDTSDINDLPTNTELTTSDITSITETYRSANAGKEVYYYMGGKATQDYFSLSLSGNCLIYGGHRGYSGLDSQFTVGVTGIVLEGNARTSTGADDYDTTKFRLQVDGYASVFARSNHVTILSGDRVCGMTLDSIGVHVFAKDSSLKVKKSEIVIGSTDFDKVGLWGSNAGLRFKYTNQNANQAFTIQMQSTSAQRYKENIMLLQDEEMAPERLYRLKAKQFRYIEGVRLQYPDTEGMTLPGFIAEDVAEIYPSAVIHDEEGNVESWDERRIIPAMLALIQEQNERIKALERMVN